MTLLAAVNEMLGKIGEPPVTTYTTGDASDAAEAEDYLLRESSRVLEEGWACNTDIDAVIIPPDRRLTYTGSDPDPSFEYGETVTQTSSGAIGTFAYIDTTNNYVYLTRVSGTFDGTNAITGADTGATITATAVATLSDGRIKVPDTWLSLKSNNLESKAIVRRGDYLYNATDMTFVFSATIRLEILHSLTFTLIPNKLARYIVLMGSRAYQNYKKRGQVDNALIERDLLWARGQALIEDNGLRDIRITQTPQAQRLKGNRGSRWGGLSTWRDEGIA